MRFIPIIAAAALATFAVPVAASAAPVAPSAPAPLSLEAASPSRAMAEQDRRHWNNRHHRRSYWKRVCRTKWRHHRKIRTCRRVRAWR